MDGMRDLAIDFRPIGELSPYARKAPTHSERGSSLSFGAMSAPSTSVS